MCSCSLSHCSCDVARPNSPLDSSEALRVKRERKALEVEGKACTPIDSFSHDFQLCAPVCLRASHLVSFDFIQRSRRAFKVERQTCTSTDSMTYSFSVFQSISVEPRRPQLFFRRTRKKFTRSINQRCVVTDSITRNHLPTKGQRKDGTPGKPVTSSGKGHFPKPASSFANRDSNQHSRIGDKRIAGKMNVLTFTPCVAT